MVSDVGGEVGELAVAFDDRAIFVVAELASIYTIRRRPANRASRARAIRSIARSTSPRSRIAFSLKKESNSMPKSRNCVRMVLSNASPPVLAEKHYGRFFWFACKNLSPSFCLNLGGDLLDVIARITAFGEIDFLPERFAIARQDGEAEIFHLIAGVVDVIFALDIKAGRLVQARQHVADHRDPAVTDVERAGRIDAGELDLHSFAVAEIELSILLQRQVRAIARNKISPRR